MLSTPPSGLMYSHVFVLPTLSVLLLQQVLRISQTCSSKMRLIQSSQVYSVLTAMPHKDCTLSYYSTASYHQRDPCFHLQTVLLIRINAIALS